LQGRVVVGELLRHPTGVDYRLHTPTSHMCQLTFRVVDKEVIVEDLPVMEKEEPSIVQSLETIEKSLVAVGTDNLTAMSRKSKSRHQKYRQSEEDSLFQRIHFYRDKLVTKRLQMGPDEIGSARQDYDVDLLPPLLKAAAKGDIEQLSGLIANDTKRLLNSRVDIRMRYDDDGKPLSGWIFNGCTPLHIACWHGQLKVVNYLLDSGADVNTPDTDGDGALWYVLGGSHPNKLWHPLVAHGADIYATSLDNSRSTRSLLQFACCKGRPEIVSYLLSKGVDMETPPQEALSTLSCAALSGNEEVFDILLEYGAVPNISTNGWKWNALHCAASGGSARITKYFVEQGFDVMAKDVDGDTPLHVACDREHINLTVADILLSAGGSLDTENREGYTPFLNACFHGNVQLIQYLLSSRGNGIASTNNSGKSTALHKAIWAKHSDVAKVLVDADASLSAYDSFGDTPLHIACARGLVDVCAYIIAKDPTTMHLRNTSNDHMPLYTACIVNGAEVVNTLIRNGADILARGKGGSAPIHEACYRGHAEIVKQLIEADKNCLTLVDNNGRYPIHEAANGGHLDVVELLLDAGAALRVYDSFGDSPPHFACSASTSNMQLIKRLLEIEPDSINRTGRDKMTPLHAACEQEAVPAVELLLTHGATLDATDGDGWNGLHYACASGNVQLVELLLRKMTPYLNVTSCIGEAPIHGAAMAGHAAIVEMILKEKPDVRIADRNGRTALHKAAHKGHLEVVKLLVQYDPSTLTIEDDFGDTSLADARSGGHEDIVSYLSSQLV
jgi:ankyrin repeat protein